MTEMIEIPKGARDQVLVFALDMPPEQVAFLRDEDAALAQALGLTTLDRAQVEIFPVEDLEGLGLLGYLREGLAVSEADLSTHGLKLDGLTGYVMVLRARAFYGAATQLSPAKGVELAARLGEAGTDWHSQGQIRSAAALPRLRTAPRVARSRARTIGATLFAVVMGLIVLLIWVLAT